MEDAEQPFNKLIESRLGQEIPEDSFQRYGLVKVTVDRQGVKTMVFVSYSWVSG